MMCQSNSPALSFLKGPCVAVAAFVLLAAGGCSMPISAKYSPIAAADSLTTIGRTPPRIFVVRYIDQREDKEFIGAMKNVYGTTVKKLVTSDDLTRILAEATTDALRKAGLQADLNSERLPTEQIPAAELQGYDCVVGGRIEQVEVLSQPGWSTLKITSRVVISLYVRKGGQDEWVGPIEGTAEKREMVYGQSSALTDALDIAMQNCMRNMVRHLKASGTLQGMQGT
ncbi:MAG: hypothetical protein WBF17_08125 [Phycisphaerae bacterium]